MRKSFLFILLNLLCLFLCACDHTEQAQEDFLKKANTFWQSAVSNNCGQIKGMVRYPILMDNKSIDNLDELNSRCAALYTSAEYFKEKKGVTKADSPLEIHESGWLKKEMLEGHPLLKVHAGNDTSFFLLEVTSAYFNDQPATFIFRRNYENKKGDWKIIMFESYSLTEMIK